MTAVALAVSCSGSPGSSPSAPVVPVAGNSQGAALPSPSPAASPSPTISPSPSPSPTAAASCRYGKGTVDTYCGRTAPAFVEEVTAAIDLLVRERPELFNLTDQSAGGGYKVLNESAYYAGVIRNLEAQDFCAGFDLQELQLKNSNEFSEQYDILLSSGHAWRGAGTYQATCSPASFPLDPEDLIDSVRVAFFGFRCLDGQQVPTNSSGKLPVGCTGTVTATPKNKDNKDVDRRIHGDRIDWILSQEESYVKMEDYPEVAFNKTLIGLQPGHFTLCAIVKGVQGCLNGEVTRE